MNELPVSHIEGKGLTDHLRVLRYGGRVEEAFRWLTEQAIQRHDDKLQSLAWQHEPFWWAPLTGPRVRLRRRGPQDLELVRRCWADQHFMLMFNRAAKQLPSSDDELCKLLQREHTSIVGESGALHWTIDVGGCGVGFVSVTGIGLGHRRAEFLIGVQDPHCSRWVGPEASHLALGFLAEKAQIERLTAYFYADNTHAIKVSQKLGFTVEGTMRGYLRRPDGTRTDLVVSGLLLDSSFFARKAGVRSRLLRSIAGS